MSDQPETSDDAGLAREMAERAMVAVEAGDDDLSDALMEAAKKLDPEAVEQFMKELEEESGDPDKYIEKDDGEDGDEAGN